jgi:hypothetical protein
MSKVRPETPTRAQQSGIGTLSTRLVGAVVATAGGGAVRITPAGGALEGAGPLNLTVAFIGVSGVGPIRAVSLRGTVEALRLSPGGITEGRPGCGGATAAFGGVGKGAGGRGAEGGGKGDFITAGDGGRGVLSPEGGGGSGAFVSAATVAERGDL